MYEKYAKRRDELGLTDYKVAQMSGVLTSTLSEWKNIMRQMDNQVINLS